MAGAKGHAVVFPTLTEAPEVPAQAILNDIVFFALPAPLFKQLSEAAARRQMVLAELLATAVSEYLKKTEPSEAPNR
jgi:hypothetical protein